MDEIGSVPRGLRLGFDSFGRIAVMYDGIYAVLSDSAWVDRIDSASELRVRMTTIQPGPGGYFYGGRGSWGTVDITPDGHFRASPLVTKDAPDWTKITPFNGLLLTDKAIYFYEQNGVVCWDFAEKRNHFIELPRVASVFRVADRIFVSCQDRQLREILPGTYETAAVAPDGLPTSPVVLSAALDGQHTLLVFGDGTMGNFDGSTVTPWAKEFIERVPGAITAMERLVDGGIALGVAGHGIYLLSPEGTVRWALSLPEFQRVRALAAGEPGVLWVAAENALHKIFYNSALTSFGQPLGLTVGWPTIIEWNGRFLVSSAGNLYQLQPGEPGAPGKFERLATDQSMISCVAAVGAHLLTGNASGVYAQEPTGAMTRILSVDNVAGIEPMDTETCIVLGSKDIVAMRFIDGKWVEFTPRIKGVGDSPIRTVRSKNVIWVEMGGDLVARVFLEGGELKRENITPPWKDSQWTNISQVDGTIMFAGSSSGRAFYNEETKQFSSVSAIDKLLARSPYWITRVIKDESGTIWAMHDHGIVTFTPDGTDYRIDATRFELRNDSYPTVSLLPGNNVWVKTGGSLYHVEPEALAQPIRPRPVLASLTADHLSLELLSSAQPGAATPRFSYNDNSLSFRFFSGTYAWRYPPIYEYRLGVSDGWRRVDPSLLLRFPKLRDGSYHLEVRHAGPENESAPAFAFSFIINPPWYRTPASYVVYIAAALAGIIGMLRWFNVRSLRRNLALEQQVQERTRELEVAMDKLSEEARNTATLAERSRLAGEIHDSLQQGLSGSILHLDTTMTHPSITPEVQSKLSVVRNMLSYSREEVQQAVWNLESPLLQNSTLGDALQKLAGYINSGSTVLRVDVPARSPILSPDIQHNLLRIAQEAITNAVKHAAASRIDVSLKETADNVLLVVHDNGIGFVEDRSPTDGKFGLRGMRSRTKTIHGRIEIMSAANLGTTVQVSVPLKTN